MRSRESSTPFRRLWREHLAMCGSHGWIPGGGKRRHRDVLCGIRIIEARPMAVRPGVPSHSCQAELKGIVTFWATDSGFPSEIISDLRLTAMEQRMLSGAKGRITKLQVRSGIRGEGRSVDSG